MIILVRVHQNITISANRPQMDSQSVLRSHVLQWSEEEHRALKARVAQMETFVARLESVLALGGIPSADDVDFDCPRRGIYMKWTCAHDKVVILEAVEQPRVKGRVQRLVGIACIQSIDMGDDSPLAKRCLFDRVVDLDRTDGAFEAHGILQEQLRLAMARCATV